MTSLNEEQRHVCDITAVLNQYRPDPARGAELKAKASAEPPRTASPAQLYDFYHVRGAAIGQLGRLKEQIADQQEAPQYMRWPAYNISHSDQRGGIQRSQIEIEMAAGRYEEAETLARAALENVWLSIRNETQIRQYIPDLAPGTWQTKQPAND